MAKVITITNQKGGVGKTTTSINVSFYLAKAGKKVLLVDFDPQGNASSGLGIEKKDLKKTMCEVMLGESTIDEVTLETKTKNLWLAPTIPELANVEAEIGAGDSKKFLILKTALAKVLDKYDYIIIDSPPSLSHLTVNGLFAANYVLIPVQTEFYALEGVAQLLKTVELVKKVNPGLQLLGVVATMYDRRTALSSQVLAEVKKYFKDKVFDTPIPRNVRLAEAPSHGVPIGQYDRFSKGAKAYKKLAEEVIERTK